MAALSSWSEAPAESTGIVLSDDIQMTLGDAFFAEADYYRAITEYRKLIFLFPQSERIPEALFQIGMAYYHGEDYSSAADSFARVRQTYAALYFSDAAFYEGLCYGKMGRHDDAALAFIRSRLFDETHPTAVNAQLGLSLSSIARGDTQTCREALSDFMASYPMDKRIPAVRKSFSLLDDYDNQSRKSPFLAGTLSAFLPGSGHVYAEHYRDGGMAFLVNSLFIAGTIMAMADENYAVGAIVGAVGLPFYVGNIYGAANAAKKWNVSFTTTLRNRLSIDFNLQY